MRPKLLDLFCGAGGAAMGYHRAGFDVVGVDIKPQKNYPFEFHQADALEYPLDGFDFIHASPPCQHYTQFLNNGRAAMRDNHPDLIAVVRERLASHRHVIENVPHAPLIDPITLCGEMFGLRVIRHRLFESNIKLTAPSHVPHQGKVIRAVDDGGYYFQPVGHNTGKREWGAAMGMEWAHWTEIAEAIPPAYSEFIGRQLI